MNELKVTGEKLERLRRGYDFHLTAATVTAIFVIVVFIGAHLPAGEGVVGHVIIGFFQTLQQSPVWSLTFIASIAYAISVAVAWMEIALLTTDDDLSMLSETQRDFRRWVYALDAKLTDLASQPTARTTHSILTILAVIMWWVSLYALDEVEATYYTLYGAGYRTMWLYPALKTTASIFFLIVSAFIIALSFVDLKYFCDMDWDVEINGGKGLYLVSPEHRGTMWGFVDFVVIVVCVVFLVTEVLF